MGKASAPSKGFISASLATVAEAPATAKHGNVSDSVTNASYSERVEIMETQVKERETHTSLAIDSQHCCHP